jgi:hypothetical protein
MVSHVTLPTPGKNRVLFSIENCLLSAEAPPKEWLPHADVWFLFRFFIWYSSLVSSNIPPFNEVHSFYSLSTVFMKLYCDCRYHSSHWCSAWMLINLYFSLLLSCLKDEYCCDQISSFTHHLPLSNFWSLCFFPSIHPFIAYTNNLGSKLPCSPSIPIKQVV